MTRHDLPWWLATLVALAVLVGCQLPLEHTACPCIEGWTCCASTSVCVAQADQCGSDDGDDDDDELDIQRLSLDEPWQQDNFGISVAFAGDRAAIGIPGYDRAGSDAGAIAVFERRGSGTGVWVRVALITAPDATAGSRLGEAVAFVGQRTLIVGAPYAGDDRNGRVYVLGLSDGGWSWQQTLAPDLTGVSTTKRGQLKFGRAIAADGARFLVGADDSISHLYEVTTAAAVHVARLTAFASPHGVSAPTGVALRGSTATFHDLHTRGVYVFDEASGWTATRVAELPVSGLFPRALAVGDRRIAIPGPPGTVRILERAGSGWGAPINVTLPTEPRAWMPICLAWLGDDVVMTTRLFGDDVLGMARLRFAGGAWQPDPITGRRSAAPEWMSLAASGARAIIGVPYGGTAASGNATVFALTDTGYVEETNLTIDDRPAIASIAGDAHHLLIRGLAEQVGWFARDIDGQYRVRPSLVVDRRSRLASLAAVSGGHALTSLHDDTGQPAGVQAFELGERDWIAGAHLAAPQSGITFPAQSPAPIAIDGDTAVIGATERVGDPSVAFVYTWSGTGWQRTATLPGPSCAPSVAIAGSRIALSCGANRMRLFEKTGDAWADIPSPVLTDAPVSLTRLVLSKDRVGIASRVAAEPHYVTDVFRWTGGTWRSELHLRTETDSFAALAGDRMVMQRDATSVTPYRFVEGAWVEQPALVLPARPRSPDARVRDVVLTETQVCVSVPSDGGDAGNPQGAIYVIPWL